MLVKYTHILLTSKPTFCGTIRPLTRDRQTISSIYHTIYPFISHSPWSLSVFLCSHCRWSDSFSPWFPLDDFWKHGHDFPMVHAAYQAPPSSEDESNRAFTQVSNGGRGAGITNVSLKMGRWMYVVNQISWTSAASASLFLRSWNLDKGNCMTCCAGRSCVSCSAA